MATVWVLAIVALLLSLIRIIFYIPSWRTYKMMQSLPGPKGLPFFGIGLELARVKIEDLLGYLTNLRRISDRICSLWVVGLPVVIVWKPEDYEAVLKSPDNITKGEEYKFIQPLLGEGVLLLGGERWRRRRKMLTPAFNFQILQRHLPDINKHTQILVQRFRDSKEQPISLYHYISRCTFDIASEAATGISMNSQNGGCDKYVEAVDSFDMTALERTQNIFYRTEWIFKLSGLFRRQKKHLDYVQNYTSEIVKKRIADYNSGKPNPLNCYLDYLTQHFMQGEDLTVKDMQNEMDTFILEGLHTVGCVMTFCVYLLGNHPEIQEKLYSEQLEIFGYENREPTINDVKKMEYLDKCVKESLRIYPVGSYLTRKVTHDITLDDGSVIPRGVNLVLSPYLLHRNPDAFPDPERFDPERFNLDETIKRHPFAYVPFSAGPRNCIGQKYGRLKVKAMLSTLVRSFKIQSVTERGSFKCIPAFALMTNKPLLVKMIPRKRLPSD